MKKTKVETATMAVPKHKLREIYKHLVVYKAQLEARHRAEPLKPPPLFLLNTATDQLFGLLNSRPELSGQSARFTRERPLVQFQRGAPSLSGRRTGLEREHGP